jgi:hydroxyacylglutathione hydrolase
MKIIKLKPLSVCDTNSYIVAGRENNCALIDAPDDADYILEQIDLLGLNLKKIFLTHGHFDHVGAVADLYDRTGCEVYIHEKDMKKLTDDSGMLVNFFRIKGARKFDKAISFGENDILTLDELEFDVLHTPGHTGGSVCFICGNEMFSGDTLFARSVGRTDMPDGDPMQLIKSLKKIMELSGNLNVYPGHMSATTLDEEKKYNPYLRGGFGEY